LHSSVELPIQRVIWRGTEEWTAQQFERAKEQFKRAGIRNGQLARLIYQFHF
jgi:hypothetical protein